MALSKEDLFAISELLESRRNEDLLAISQLIDVKMDARLQPIRDDIRDIKLDIENSVKPNIQLLAENYVPAAKRFEKASSQIEAVQSDVELLKRVVTEHSNSIQKLSLC